MNNQEAFNLMVQHLRKQGQRSLLDDVSGTCAYRGKDGLKCAIGALISDSEYKEEFEGKPVSSLSDYGLFKDLDSGLLADMQGIHDFGPIRYWESRFKDIAEEYDLTLPKEKAQ